MSKALRKLLGTELARHGRRVSVEEIPPGAILGLYFVEEWSESGGGEESLGNLMKFYDEIKRTDRLFDVILIPVVREDGKTSGSSRNGGSSASSRLLAAAASQSTFLSLHGTDAHFREEYLIRKYGVYGSSGALILIDSTSAAVINFNAMRRIREDPKGIDFPFKNRPYYLILSSGPLISLRDRKKKKRSAVESHLPNNIPATPSKGSPCAHGSDGGGADGDPALPTLGPANASPDYLTVYGEQKKHDFKGFFFGAHWCPPCRSFCANLVQVYKRLRKERRSFEVIFVSSDRSKESFDKFFATMPWLAVPYEDEGRREELTDWFNVKAIPSLIIVDDQSEKIITSEGRLEIDEDLEALDFPWYPKLVEELKDRHSTDLNTSLCIIYFTKSGDNDQEFEMAESILHPAAAQMIESDVEEAFQPKFFIGMDSELSESLRLFIDLDDSVSYIVILDVPHFKYFSFPASIISTGSQVLDYFEKFRNSQLPCHHIRGHGRITV